MDHLAGLAGQGLAGHGAIGRVQVALAQRVVVGTGRAGARRDRDIRARPLVAAQRWADADDAGAVFLHQVAARHHVQQAGARHLDVGIPDVAAACSSETSDGPLCRNTPPRPAMSRPASAWTGAAARSQLRMLRLVCGRYCTDMPVLRPTRSPLHRIEADRFRSFRARDWAPGVSGPKANSGCASLVGATGPSARGTGEPSMLLLCEPRCRPPARSYPA